MKGLKSLFTIIALTLATAASAQQGGSLWWGFWQGDDVPDNYLGVSKEAVYEAALRLDGTIAPLKGAQVKAVRLPFSSTEHVDSLTLWLTTVLGEENVASIRLANPQPGWNVVELPEAVSVPEQGLYVGYTFRVTALDGQSERPLIMCNEVNDDGLYLRVKSVRQYADWYNTRRYGSLAMQLLLTGDQLPRQAAQLLSMKSNNVVHNTTDSLSVTVANQGTEPISSLQYSYSFGDETHTGSYQLPTPLPNIYGLQTQLSLPVTAPEATGRMTLSLHLTGINGQPITQHPSTLTQHPSPITQHPSPITQQVLSLAHATHHRTVMEEYTGTWCSACPRGFAGIARLKKMYPDDFIAVSVHVLNGDPMDVYYDYYHVMNATQFPSCRFDRGPLTDPYDGDISDGHFHADLNFRQAHDVKAPADLSVSAQWLDTEELQATANVSFAFDDDECRYSLAYIMIEDSLRGPDDDHSWHQMNSFSNPIMSYYVEDDMQQYVNAEGTMLHNVAYNDVVIAMSDLQGIEGSLQGAQTVGTDKTHSFRLKRTAVSQHRHNISVVALLIDNDTKLIANAAICRVQQAEAIAPVSAANDGHQQHFDLQGRRLLTPRKGLNIVRRADGSTVKLFF